MLLFQTENGKRMPRQFSLIRLPFANRANGSMSFVRLFTKNNLRKISVRKRTKWINGLDHLCINLQADLHCACLLNVE